MHLFTETMKQTATIWFAAQKVACSVSIDLGTFSSHKKDKWLYQLKQCCCSLFSCIVDTQVCCSVSHNWKAIHSPCFCFFSGEGVLQGLKTHWVKWIVGKAEVRAPTEGLLEPRQLQNKTQHELLRLEKIKVEVIQLLIVTQYKTIQ